MRKSIGGRVLFGLLLCGALLAAGCTAFKETLSDLQETAPHSTHESKK